MHSQKRRKHWLCSLICQKLLTLFGKKDYYLKLNALSSTKYFFKAKKPKDFHPHPIHDKFQANTKNRLKKKTLNHFLKELQSSQKDLLGGEAETLKSEPWLLEPGSIVLNSQSRGHWSKKGASTRRTQSTNSTHDSGKISISNDDAIQVDQQIRL